MKRNKDFIADQIAGEYVAVPIGEMSKAFHGMIRLNDTARFIWDQLENDVTEAQIVDALLANYEVDRSCAERDVRRIVEMLKDAGIVMGD